jgi:uncharacterized membrane protein YoaK (UPF0700 family)
MVLTVSSGAIDAISYLALGKVFTAFMTGNIVFLGLRAARAGDFDVVRIAIALACYSAGCFLGTLIAKSSRGSGNDSGLWPRRASVALGVVVIAQAGFLAVWVATDGWPSNGVTNVLVGIWAVAMGMQTVTVFSLGVKGVFTTAMTATVVVLMADITAWPRSATERRRLAGVLVSLFSGAAAGGLLLKYASFYAPFLPLVGGAFALAIAALAPWKRGAADDPDRR